MKPFIKAAQVKLVPAPKSDEQLCAGLSLRRSGVGRMPDPERHLHDFHQITWVTRKHGQIDWTLEGQSTTRANAEQGDIVICPAYLPHQVVSESPFNALTLRFSTKFINRVSKEIGLHSYEFPPCIAKGDRFIESTIHRLDGSQQRGRKQFSESIAKALAIHLLTEYAQAQAAEQSARPLSDQEMLRIARYLDRHLAEPISVSQLAKCVSLSPSYFTRCFENSTGLTPYQYVIKCRTLAACQLIAQGQSILQAALNVGFASQSHFHSHMKRLLNMTPGYFQRNREEIDLSAYANTKQCARLDP